MDVWTRIVGADPCADANVGASERQSVPLSNPSTLRRSNAQTLRRSRRLLLRALCLPLCALCVRADVVVLKNGGKIEGRVVEKGTVIEVHVGAGKTVVPKSEIARIQRGAVTTDEYEKRKGALRPDDAEGLYQLGLWCRKSGLADQADAAFADVMKLKPNHPGAREALGFSLVNGRWIQGEWRNVVSERFRLETDCPEWLIRGMEEALDRYYAALAAEFGPNLAWVHPEHPYIIQFFRRKSDYQAFMKKEYGDRIEAFRQPETMPRGWADAARGRVYTCYETDPALSQDLNREIALYVLFHEANHLIWWQSVLHAPGGDPQAYLEGRFSWFEEGLAEYFALTRFELNRYRIHVPGVDPVRRGHLRTLHDAFQEGKYAPLRDYVGKKSFDFTKSDIHVMYAQAWSFVDFCFRGDKGKHRAAFWRYLDAVRKGRGDKETLETLLGLKVDEIESAWLLHVKGMIDDELK